MLVGVSLGYDCAMIRVCLGFVSGTHTHICIENWVALGFHESFIRFVGFVQGMFGVLFRVYLQFV